MPQLKTCIQEDSPLEQRIIIPIIIIPIIIIRFLEILYKNLKELGNACDLETLCLGSPQQIPLDKLNEYYERYPFYLEAYQIMCANCKRVGLYIYLYKLVEEIP